jgi:hypothetical protein
VAPEVLSHINDIDPQYKMDWLLCFSEHDLAREEIKKLAVGGNREALAYCVETQSCDNDLLARFNANAIADCQELVKGVETGSIAIGGSNELLELTWASLLTASEESWQQLFDTLRHTLVPWSLKRQPLWLIAEKINEISPTVREELIRLLPVLERGGSQLLDLERSSRGPLLAVHLALSDKISPVILNLVYEMLRDDYASRRDLAKTLHLLRLRLNSDGILLALLTDASAQVRGIAAQELMRRAYGPDGDGNSRLLAGAVSALTEDRGALVPLLVAEALSELSLEKSPHEGLIEFLRRHPSARVRRALPEL